MSVIRTCRDVNTGTLRVPHELASKINLKLPFQDQTNVPLFTPVRFDELACEFNNPNLFSFAVECLEASTRCCAFPRQGVEIDTKRIHRSNMPDRYGEVDSAEVYAHCRPSPSAAF